MRKKPNAPRIGLLETVVLHAGAVLMIAAGATWLGDLVFGNGSLGGRESGARAAIGTSGLIRGAHLGARDVAASVADARRASLADAPDARCCGNP